MNSNESINQHLNEFINYYDIKDLNSFDIDNVKNLLKSYIETYCNNQDIINNYNNFKNSSCVLYNLQIKDFTCIECNKIYKKPYSCAYCNFTLCKVCLVNLSSNKQQFRKQPLKNCFNCKNLNCQKNISNNSGVIILNFFYRNRFIEKLISKININCKYCNKELMLNNLSNHIINDCCKLEYNCHLCKNSIKVSTIKAHILNCQKLCITCKHCNNVYDKILNYINHIYECSNKRSICELCNKEIKFSELEYHKNSHECLSQTYNNYKNIINKYEKLINIINTKNQIDYKNANINEKDNNLLNIIPDKTSISSVLKNKSYNKKANFNKFSNKCIDSNVEFIKSEISFSRSSSVKVKSNSTNINPVFKLYNLKLNKYTDDLNEHILEDTKNYNADASINSTYIDNNLTNIKNDNFNNFLNDSLFYNLNHELQDNLITKSNKSICTLKKDKSSEAIDKPNCQTKLNLEKIYSDNSLIHNSDLIDINILKLRISGNFKDIDDEIIGENNINCLNQLNEKGICTEIKGSIKLELVKSYEINYIEVIGYYNHKHWNPNFGSYSMIETSNDGIKFSEVGLLPTIGRHSKFVKLLSSKAKYINISNKQTAIGLSYFKVYSLAKVQDSNLANNIKFKDYIKTESLYHKSLNERIKLGDDSLKNITLNRYNNLYTNINSGIVCASPGLIILELYKSIAIIELEIIPYQYNINNVILEDKYLINKNLVTIKHSYDRINWRIIASNYRLELNKINKISVPKFFKALYIKLESLGSIGISYINYK